MKIGDTVFTKTQGEGKIVTIEGTKAVVNFNGIEKTMMTFLLKSKPATKKVKSFMKKEGTQTITFNSVVDGIKGDRTSRGSMFGFSDIYTTIEKMAFNNENGTSELAGKIIEDARNGKFVSYKQACVVAFYAKNNGLLK